MVHKHLLTALLVSFVLTLTTAMTALAWNEAPMTAEKVEEGLLPPVDERLPEDPYVVEPIERIGEYGGTIRVASTRPDSWGDDSMIMSGMSMIQTMDWRTGEFIPHLASEVEVSPDLSTFTIHFRKGVKWSNGAPFTTEDIMFWYEDVLHNEELTPVVGSAWRYDGEVVDVVAVDEYTVQFRFPGPNPGFPYLLVHNDHEMLTPKHYLKNFHPKYVPAEELQRKVREAGYNDWFELFAYHQDTAVGEVPMVVGLPTLNSYVMVEETSGYRIYERNPYYWKVDTEGNQLPYIDRIFTEIVANREILNGKIIAGELDFAAFENDIRNYPLYRRYEGDGNFRTILWESGMGSDVTYQLNLTHQDDVLRAILQDVRFRRALSLAINREEINQQIYFGRAAPRQFTVLERHPAFKPEYAQAYVEYDPERAKALLDEMGLEVGPQGFRLRPDGKRLSFTIEYYDSETPKGPNVELVTKGWREIGIDVSMRPVSDVLQEQRATANLMDASLWHGDSVGLFPFQTGRLVQEAPSWSNIVFTEWARWFSTQGEEGAEPPREVKEMYNWRQEVLHTPSQERVTELAQKMLQSQADNLWLIGTVGKAPYPIIARNTLHNVPEEGYWSWDYLWTMTRDPEQIFIDQ